MPSYVGLLRAVNLGGTNKVPMAELRALLESMGHSDVTTVLQSGNVIFTSRRPTKAEPLEAAIEAKFGLAIDVLLRSPDELRQVLSANPFPHADASSLHVGFMAQAPAPAVLAKLDAGRFRPEEFAIRGADLYLHLPNGMGKSKLPPYLARQLKIPTTIRNWNTVTKLAELTRR